MSESPKAPAFSSIPFFVYPVSDMARSRGFYSGVLGLSETGSWEDKWVEFAVGDGTIALSTVMMGATPGVKGGAVALETERFEDAVAALKSAGVRFALEPTDTGFCMLARFEDPDGNHIVLHRKHRA